MKIKSNSLQRKLLISILTSVLLLVLMAVAVAFGLTLKRTEQRTEVMLDQLLNTVESSASAAVYTRNQALAGDLIDGLLKNDSVYSVTLHGVDGFHANRAKPETNPSDTQIMRNLYFQFGDKELLGYIAIGVSQYFVIAETEQNIITNLLFSVLIILITALTILYVVERDFSRPIKLVGRALHEIRSGAKNRLPVLKNHLDDELGYLVHDINKLLETLEENFNQEHALRQKVQQIEQQLRDIFNHTSAGVFRLDANGRHLTSNLTLKKLLNSAIIDDSAYSDHHAFSSFFNEKTQFEELIVKTLNADHPQNLDISLNNPEYGETVWLHCLMTKVIDNSGELCVQGVLFDITQRVYNELAIKHEADHDPLTGLLRRQAAKAEFESYLQNTDKPKVSMFLLDLDGFKKANDQYGHLIGDQVLAIAAERLLRCVRSTDIVSRLGGDEFLIILLDWDTPDIKLKIAENIIKSIQNKVNIEQYSVVIGVSIGIVDYSPSMQDFVHLLDAADEAMYEVKRNGKNGFCVNDNGRLKTHLIRPDAI